MTIGPWLLFLIYDFLLYLWRSATHEIPYIGGRARGRQRPRAPNLAERPSGDPPVSQFWYSRITSGREDVPVHDGRKRGSFEQAGDEDGSNAVLKDD